MSNVTGEGEINFDDFLLKSEQVFQKEEEPEEIKEEVKEEVKEEIKEEPEEVKEEAKEEIKEVEDLPEDVQALYEKAQEDMDSLTEEETKTLEEHNLFDDGEEDGGEASVRPLIELIHEENGWDFDEEKFKGKDSVEDLMEFVGDVIEQNSKPEFASDQVAEFNEFVAKHGADKAADFLAVSYGTTNYETVDLTNEDNQKTVYGDYLRSTTKFSEAKITKEINKLVDLDELSSEMDEAKDYLIEEVKTNKEAYVKEQEEAKEANASNLTKYLGEQKERIDSSKEIAGFELNDKDKAGLYKFAFESDRNGKTGYQKMKEADKDLDLKLLLLAYKGVDKNKIAKTATTATVRQLKKNLSRFKDNKAGGGTGVANPKKDNPNADINYNDFILK